MLCQYSKPLPSPKITYLFHFHNVPFINEEVCVMSSTLKTNNVEPHKVNTCNCDSEDY